MSQRFGMVLLVTSTIAATACKDGDHQGTFSEDVLKNDAATSHMGHDAATEDQDSEKHEDAGVGPGLDASDGLDAAASSDASEHDASDPDSGDADTEDAATADASV